MHDVILLMPKIIKWINLSLQYYSNREPVSNKADELYQEFKSGIILALILYLYEDTIQPDFKMIYEHPINRYFLLILFLRQEVLNNLSYVFQVAYKCMVPIYLKPQEYLDHEYPSFLHLTLYYLYCKYKDCVPQFRRDQCPPIIFKDDGRIIGIFSKQAILEDKSSYVSSTPKREQTESENPSAMGVIDEVDSIDFSSTMKSGQTQARQLDGVNIQQPMAGGVGGKKMKQFLNPINMSEQQQPMRESEKVKSTSADYKYNYNDEDIMDEYEENHSEAHSDYQNMKKNISIASQALLQKSMTRYHNPLATDGDEPEDRNQEIEELKEMVSHVSNKPSVITQYQIVGQDEGGAAGMFNTTIPPSQNQSQIYQAPYQTVSYLQERKGMLVEDLRRQVELMNIQGRTSINEEVIAQFYYNSALSGTGHQTAHFSNFNTQQEQISYLNEPQRPPTHVKNDSLMVGNQIQAFNSSAGGLRRSNFNTVQTDKQEYKNEKLQITDENGDLEEIKCLQLLFVPVFAKVWINKQEYQKVAVMLKASEACYSELNESYLIRVQEVQRKSQVLELRLQNIESIVMKNMIQKQFMIAGDNGRMQVTLDYGGEQKNDLYFQAFNYIYQRTTQKRM